MSHASSPDISSDLSGGEGGQQPDWISAMISTHPHPCCTACGAPSQDCLHPPTGSPTALRCLLTEEELVEEVVQEPTFTGALWVAPPKASYQ